MNQDHSPIFSKNIIGMDFPKAIEAIIDGKRVTKGEWLNNNVYGYLKNGFLTIHKEDKKDYQWLVSEADLTGTDWMVVGPTLKEAVDKPN